MLYPKIEDCIQKAGNSKYTLVAMVAKRAKDLTLHAGTVEVGKEKQISCAMREVMDGKLAPIFTATQAVRAQ